MKFHAREVVLTTDGSVAMTYACAAAYALLSMLLLVRYAHNAVARNLSPFKPAMLLLLGFVVYCAVRSGTLVYSAVIEHITNTVLVLPTALYLVLMGCMARLWTLYLGVLRGEADGASGGASASPHPPQAAALPPPSLLDTTVSTSSRSVTVIRSPLAAALLSPPPPSPFNVHDGTASVAHHHAVVAPPRRWNVRRLLYVGVLVVAGACALIILLAGVICITVTGLEATHCIDVPSAADVVACWACGGLLVAISVQLYHARDQQQSNNDANHSRFGDRKASTSSSAATAVSIPTLAATSGGLGGGSTTSSSDPEIDRLNQVSNMSASCCCRCSSLLRGVRTVYHSPHLRTVAAAAIFGVYTVARGCIVALNLVAERVDITNTNEEYVTPGFYVVEWLFLAGCVRLIIGPPQ